MKSRLTFIIFLFTIVLSAQNIIYVDIDATSGTNNGTNWANAYTDIQTAINNAISNDEIWIAEGTYRLTSRADNFSVPANLDNLKIYGGFVGTETLLSQRDFRTNTVILSGDVSGNDGPNVTFNRSDNAYNVLVVMGDNLLIDGVTISGGHADGSTTINQNGGGIHKVDAAEGLTVRNCALRVNFALSGGGAIYAFAEADSTLEVTGCEFRSNAARWAAGIYATTISGAINYSVNIHNNLFRFGRTGIGAQPLYAGSAMWLRAISAGSTLNADIVNNTIFQGLDAFDLSAVGTSTNENTPVGVEQNSGATIITNYKNNIHANNRDERNDFSRPVASFISGDNGSLTITNSISDMSFAGTSPAATEMNNFTSVTNTTPLFIDQDNENYALLANSVARDFGDNNALPASITEDFAGNMRIENSVIDAGAYEYAIPAPKIIYVDKNATGSNNGRSWTNAYVNLQTAINSALSNDEIWIADGTYRLSSRTDSYTIPNGKDNLSLYGGFSGTETMLSQRDFRTNETLLTGDVSANDDTTVFNNRTDNAYNVITVGANNILIDGLTITGGHADSGSVAQNQSGGGIHKLTSAENLTVKNCLITLNYALNGGAGIFAWAETDNSLEVTGCEFRSNESRWGTGIYAVTITGTINYTVNIYNNLFLFNTAGVGALPRYAGSAMWLRAISSGSTLNAEIVNNTIYGNVDSEDLAGSGGNVGNDNTPVGVEQSTGATIVTVYKNNITKNNKAENNTIANAISSFISENNGSITITNSIDERLFGGTDPTASTSNNILGINNSTPLFVDQNNANFALLPNAVARDFGDNAALPSTITEDLAGNPRIENSSIDAGAFEYIFQPPTVSYVDLDATGSNDGSSWANAFTDINSAVVAAPTNSQLWIAEGVYTLPTGNATQTFLVNKEGLMLYGGFVGNEMNLTDRDINLHKTVLTGDRLANDNNAVVYDDNTRNDNVYHVVTIAAENIVLDGLTITNGYAYGSNANALGAGIFKNEAIETLTIANCFITRNVANGGGAGLYARFLNTTSNTGNITIENTTFFRNLATYGASIYSYTDNNSGVVDFTVSNSLFLNNLVIDDNSGITTNQAFAGSGGWFRSLNSSSTFNVTLANNTYTENSDNGTQPSMNASTRSTLGLSQDLGILNADVSNCIFYDNLSSPGGNPNQVATSISRLSSPSLGLVTVNNSLDQDTFSQVPSANVNNSISSNPLFADTSNAFDFSQNDYSLQSGSPAIDTGNNTFVIGNEDLNGDVRIFNNTVDMGAYEFGSALSTQDFALEAAFKVYPNPTASVLYIKSPQSIENIEIFSTLGKRINNISNHNWVNVSNLKSGIYFVKIVGSNGKTQTLKFIKK